MRREKLSVKHAFGQTDLRLPPIVFGTSCLGNLYRALPWQTKREIVEAFFATVEAPVVLDTAGKYGAGLALEVIGKAARDLGIPSEALMISNKLGWKRVPLQGPEPTFEPGAWADLEHDARQCINYDGILECWEQGRALLGGLPTPIVSVHDPDEYLAAADGDADREKRFEDVVEAYRALHNLKKSGDAAAVGVGAKDWHVIRDLADHVELDWVMFACSLTVMTHPPELLAFMESLQAKGIAMINSAVFHAGFLTGGEFFDYRRVSSNAPEDAALFDWRRRFHECCTAFDVKPAEACVRFGMSVPGVLATALNTSKPSRVANNVDAVQAQIPSQFWTAMKDQDLIRRDFPFLG